MLFVVWSFNPLVLQIKIPILIGVADKASSVFHSQLVDDVAPMGVYGEVAEE